MLSYFDIYYIIFCAATSKSQAEIINKKTQNFRVTNLALRAPLPQCLIDEQGRAD
jgi:hypothetical protein